MSFDNKGLLFFLLAILFIAVIIIAISSSKDKRAIIDDDHFLRATMSRRDYYRNVYLKSDAWQRKRYVVLKRDNWTCRKCGGKATDVHHERYARKIGTEPIKWLIAICRPCHVAIHGH